jgi:hypothetical protein
MPLFQQYFDALGHNIKVSIINKQTRAIRTVDIRIAARMSHVPLGDLVEVMRVEDMYENEKFAIFFGTAINKRT